MDALDRGISAIQVAITKLSSMRSVEPLEQWVVLLTQYRETLAGEYAALPPPTRDKHTRGRHEHLGTSIRVIDSGLGALGDSGYNLTTLR